MVRIVGLYRAHCVEKILHPSVHFFVYDSAKYLATNHTAAEDFVTDKPRPQSLHWITPSTEKVYVECRIDKKLL
jgi:hypothetical protein